MSPNKGETAIPGYHWPHDMAVCMREVLARLSRGLVLCAPCFKFALFQGNFRLCNQITCKFNLFSEITVIHDIFKQIEQHARYL